MPFLVGGAIAFVINVPMKSIERHLFAKEREACKMEKTRCLSADACACDRYYHAGTCGRDTGAWKYDFHDCTAGSGCGKSRTEVADRSSGQLSGTCPAVAELNIDWSSLADSIVTFVQNFAAGVVRLRRWYFFRDRERCGDVCDCVYVFHLCAVPEGASGETGKTDSVRSLFRRRPRRRFSRWQLCPIRCFPVFCPGSAWRR